MLGKSTRIPPLAALSAEPTLACGSIRCSASIACMSFQSKERSPLRLCLIVECCIVCKYMEFLCKTFHRSSYLLLLLLSLSYVCWLFLILTYESYMLSSICDLFCCPSESHCEPVLRVTDGRTDRPITCQKGRRPRPDSRWECSGGAPDA